MTTIKPKKGNVVALERNHCSIDVHFKKTSWHSYRLATVHKVNREGRVTEVKVIGTDEIVHVSHPYRCFVITGTEEQREGAIRLAKAVNAETNRWDDREKLKDAILYAFHFNRAPVQNEVHQ
jgi:hypothetical protein